MKIANFDGENLHIFWKTWGISMNFLGKMWLMTILKVKKETGPHLLSKKYIFGKTRGEGQIQIDPPPAF